MSQPCPDCESPVVLGNRGNGRCRTCHGRGTNNTFVNDISGSSAKCRSCSGDGQCKRCGGTGSIAGSATATQQRSATQLEPDREVPASNLEKSWYGLCNSSKFIPASVVDSYVARLKAAGKPAAIVVGLNDFTGQSCPRCGDEGQFKFAFLGRLEHPGCGHQWYASPGTYAGYQLGQILHTGIRAGGAMKDDADRKNDKVGGWIQGFLAFFAGAIFRAGLAIVLIPVQAVMSLNQSKTTSKSPNAEGN